MNKLRRKFITEDLKLDIIKQIKKGQLKAGDPILSLNQMVDRYRISKSSVEKGVKELITEGIIESVRGKGNFVRSAGVGMLKGNREGTHLGLSYPFESAKMQLLEEIQDYVLKCGGLLTMYDVSEDSQDPEKERLFLETLEQNSASGAVIFATPLEPRNTKLFRQLRERGMKIALISPPAYDVNDEVMFLPDFRLGGYLAVDYFVEQGYKQVSLVRTGHHPVYCQWLEEGIFSSASKNNVELIESEFRVKGPEKGKNLSLAEIVEMNRDIIPGLKKLPDKTGLIFRASCDAYVVKILLAEIGGKNPKDIGLMPLGTQRIEHLPGIPYIDDHAREVVYSAINYLLDDQIDPTMTFQKFIKPEIVIPSAVVSLESVG